ncbi:UNVERIFIED_CONTAM: Transcription factor UNE10 [Sesamum calycinum]|uniref:Transcription factor UNE10 n=1 Tax=Sesamum calycinum TaxID=2727403 RepID=A0AAW2SYC2_9LAMI
MGTGGCMVECSTRVGSYIGSGGGASLEAGARITRVGINSCKTNGSVSESTTCGRGDSCPISLDTCEREPRGGGFTCPAFLVTPKKTIPGKECSRASGNAHDSRESGDEEAKKKGNDKSSISTKRSRAADVHNQSERTDKASMLDEVIEYLRQLQAQVQMMGRMNMSSMMLPLAMQQQLQMSMMPHMGMGIGMGMGMPGVMEMNAISRAGGMPPVIPPTNPFMPLPSGDRLPAGSAFSDPLSIFLACQSQPMGMDAYSRLAALYQQMQQPPTGSVGSGSDSRSGSGSGPKI